MSNNNSEFDWIDRTAVIAASVAIAVTVVYLAVHTIWALVR